ncbi:MAG: RimK family alpha-L-glutamate ligase [Jatrophihabitantaceae bacterium]
MSSAIAIAGCDRLPGGEAEDRLLVAALADLGLTGTVLSWTDPAVGWAEFEATVIRSTWDYTMRRRQFLAWAETVPRLHNPVEVLRDNSDKRYLARLAAAGIPIVPSEFFAPGERVRLPVGTEFVVKPSVGAGSIGAGRFPAGAHASALAHADMLHRLGRTVMVQPYLAEVDSAGETALIFLDGRYSHAIRKSALLPPDTRYRLDSPELFLTETIRPRQPTVAELELAERVHAELAGLAPAASAPLLYTRIDLLPSPAGPRLLEVELIEPSLFLEHAEGSAQRLAAAIADRVGAGRAR